jgi:choline kinase
MFQYLKKNYGKTCFDIVFAIFNSSIFLAFIDFVDDGCWYLYKWYFVQKELVNLEKNSIYISYERFNSIDQEENISKAGQFLRKYKLDNAADV